MKKTGHPAIMVKGMILARSGVYQYSYDEMIARGAKPKIKKDSYLEYRPADVLVRNKDKFAFAVVTREHTREETNSDNFTIQAGGVVGNKVNIVPLGDDEIALQADAAFYTKDTAQYYEDGNRETSADYRSVVVASKDPRYDFKLVDILSVNGVAITAQGRGGSNVRVLDSANRKKPRDIGGSTMLKKGILAIFGIGRSKDDNFKLSGVVMEKVKTFHTLDSAGKEAAIDETMGYITKLSDREDRQMLIGAVTDAFTYSTEVVGKEEEVSRVIDTLYSKCVEADDTEVKSKLGISTESKTTEDTSTQDSAEQEDGKEDMDVSALVSAAVEKAVAGVEQRVVDSISSSLEDKIGAMVKKALGINEGEEDEKHSKDSLLSDDSDDDGEFLLDSTFGGFGR